MILYKTDNFNEILMKILYHFFRKCEGEIMSEMLNEKKKTRYTHATIKKKTLTPGHLLFIGRFNFKKKLKSFFLLKKRQNEY